MLPKIVSVFKKVHLPIINKDVKVNAYNLGEEKTFVALKESDNKEDVENYIIELLKNKTSDINIEELTSFDIIILLIAMVDISKGSDVELEYRCLVKDKNGVECNEHLTKKINITDYKIEGEVSSSKLFKINDNITVELGYPTYMEIKNLIENYKDDAEYTIRFYSKCVKAVYEGEDVYTSSDFTEDEIYKWIYDLPHTVINVFEDFISKMPKIVIEYEIECPKCGTIHKYRVDDIMDFFI